jgi:non-canonical (house-cleaning) NTP pyrophosphatase
MEVPHSKTGFMEAGVCAIYDGKNISLGISPAFEWPKQATKLILSNEADGSQALKKLGMTEHEKLGATSGGAIGMLTNGKLTREDFVKYSAIMAIVQIEHPHYY